MCPYGGVRSPPDGLPVRANVVRASARGVGAGWRRTASPPAPTRTWPELCVARSSARPNARPQAAGRRTDRRRPPDAVPRAQPPKEAYSRRRRGPAARIRGPGRRAGHERIGERPSRSRGRERPLFAPCHERAAAPTRDAMSDAAAPSHRTARCLTGPLLCLVWRDRTGGSCGDPRGVSLVCPPARRPIPRHRPFSANSRPSRDAEGKAARLGHPGRAARGRSAAQAVTA
jgi:hypothetical protein